MDETTQNTATPADDAMAQLKKRCQESLTQKIPSSVQHPCPACEHCPYCGHRTWPTVQPYVYPQTTGGITGRWFPTQIWC